ncbi:MAG: hypothetical protein ACI4I4_05895 [Acutalibacteraceae bacterium]
MSRIVEKVNFPIPKQPKAKRVAAYARVSSGKDEMLHSLSAQISYYSELIQSHRQSLQWKECIRCKNRLR